MVQPSTRIPQIAGFLYPVSTCTAGLIEKIVFVEKAAPEPVSAPKKKVPHLRAVPPPMSLPFFDDTRSAALNVSSLADEERAKLADLLDELEGLKARLRQART